MTKKTNNKSKGGFTPKPDSIALFKNETDNEKAPSFTGTLTIGDEVIQAVEDGVETLRVSVWRHKSQSGKSYLQGVVQVPTEGSKQSSKEDNDDDESDDEHEDW